MGDNGALLNETAGIGSESDLDWMLEVGMFSWDFWEIFCRTKFE